MDIAKELRDSIAASDNITEGAFERVSEIRQTQTRLAQKLQTALSALQVQVIDSAQELAPALSTEVLQRIAKVTAQLQADLVAVTGVQVALQAPTDALIETAKPGEIAESQIARVVPELVTAATGTEPIILEGVRVVDPSLSEQLIPTTEILEQITAESKEVITSEIVNLLSTEDNSIMMESVRAQTDENIAIEGTETVIVEQTDGVSMEAISKEDATLSVIVTDQAEEVSSTMAIQTESDSAVIIEDLGPEFHEVTTDDKHVEVEISQTAELQEPPKATIGNLLLCLLLYHIDCSVVIMVLVYIQFYNL